MSAIARGVAQRIAFGLFSSSTGDILSGVSPAATVSKDGGAFAAVSDAPVEIGSTGVYELTLTNTEMDADVVALKVTATGGLTKTISIYTDTIAADIANVQSDTDNIQTRLPAALVSGRMDSSVGAMAANTLTASALATDAVNEIVDQVWDEASADHNTNGTMGGAVEDNAAGFVTLISEHADIQADTDDIQTRLPASLSGGRMRSQVEGMDAGTITATAIASNAIDDDALAADLDTYQADIRVFKDSTTDYYEVVYKKNSHPVTSGITSPTIQVIKASDGSDLVASTALTQIASTGYYKKDEGTNRIDFGNRYIVVVTATIDGSTRTMAVGVGRDG